ncbi:MAG: hypothetical protein CMJ08_03300 [Pelagibacterales bacterium]|nr:hypothetical protein [Pelagibacterales bacterium]
MDENENLVFVLGPTNTGKTYYAIEKMLTYPNGVIGLPLRLLAREVYEKVVNKVGKLKVSLVTGEEQISPTTAKYFITTVEAMPTEKSFDFVAVDEIQLCNDFERGHVFTDRLLNFRGNIETLFLGSDSMENILKSMFPKSSILEKKRRSKLSFIGKKGLLSLPKRSAVIAFNSNDVYSIASKIKALKGGAAVVMGSLSPQTRNSQVSMFEEGTVDYIVATDAIGMGLNLDIKNASFSSIRKFDGKENRFLKDSELGQIAGRAGRNIEDGAFSTTLNCQNLTNKTIKSIETNNYQAIEFLFWRESSLDFSSVYNLLKSLEKKSTDPRLIKTQNKRDENTLKFLSSLKLIREKLFCESNIKLLWDISTIPDYFKNLDNIFSDLLVKIYCNIVDSGYLNTPWAISETKKLQNLEGSIDMLTFRLAKTRFWNYISNRTHWTKNNQDLKQLALETERLLSDALHQRLTNEFVDKKLRIFLKEYNLKKSLEVKINPNNEILLNERAIGKIYGFLVKIYDQESLFKNKFLKIEVSKKVKLLLEQYASHFINNNINIIIDREGDLYVNLNKIGYLWKGKNLLEPKIIINNNHYLNQSTYLKILEKVNLEIKKKIYIIFWNPELSSKINNRKIHSFLFSLDKNFGVVNLNDPKNDLIKLSIDEKKSLFKNNIIFGKSHAFYKSLVLKNYKDIRWALGSLYFKGKIMKMPPNVNVLVDIKNISENLLHLIGYIKIKNMAVKVSFLEKIAIFIFRRKKSMYYFDYCFLYKFKISSFILHDILMFLGFTKIAGTSNVSYWIKQKIKNYKSTYDKDNPFYVLKKLQ